jgi:AP-4 complex subunit mu-1
MALELWNAIVGRISDFCGGLNEENLRTNFVLIYELIDEIVDYGHPQFTDPEILKEYTNNEAEKIYASTVDYLVSQIPLDKLRLTDSVSEKDSEKSIVKMSHDIFVEINEKISAQFTSNGFAIHIKINGIISVKNYIAAKTNLRVQLLDNFTIMNDNTFLSE